MCVCRSGRSLASLLRGRSGPMTVLYCTGSIHVTCIDFVCCVTGLYECKAANKGGEYYKSGHITVEFPPTFEDQLVEQDRHWSWDQRPTNLSCLGS